MKKVTVNGFEIAPSAIAFELERLMRFYRQHGVSDAELEKTKDILSDKALDQAIGARLLLDRALELDLPVSAAELDREEAKVIAQVGGRDNYVKALEAQGLNEKLFRKELEKGAKVNKLVEQAASEVADPTEAEVEDFYKAHQSEYAPKTIVDVHDTIKDLLRHDARGRALDAFVRELKENAKIVVEEEKHEHTCSCGHHHH